LTGNRQTGHSTKSSRPRGEGIFEIGIAERKDAVERAGTIAFRGSRSLKPARQLNRVVGLRRSIMRCVFIVVCLGAVGCKNANDSQPPPTLDIENARVALVACISSAPEKFRDHGTPAHLDALRHVRPLKTEEGHYHLDATSGERFGSNRLPGFSVDLKSRTFSVFERESRGGFQDGGIRYVQSYRWHGEFSYDEKGKKWEASLTDHGDVHVNTGP